MPIPIEFSTDEQLLDRMKELGDPAELLREMTLGARRMDATSLDLPMPVVFALLKRLGVDLPEDDLD